MILVAKVHSSDWHSLKESMKAIICDGMRWQDFQGKCNNVIKS